MEGTAFGLFEANVRGTEEKHDIPNNITGLRIQIRKKNLQKSSKLVTDLVETLEIPFW